MGVNLAQSAVSMHHVSPVGLGVVLQELLLQRLDAHKPRAHGAADQRRVRAVSCSECALLLIHSQAQPSGCQTRKIFLDRSILLLVTLACSIQVSTGTR